MQQQQQLSPHRKEVNTKKARVELGRMRKTRLECRSESSAQRRFQQLERVRGI